MEGTSTKLTGMHSAGAWARVGGRQTRRRAPVLVCALPHSQRSSMQRTHAPRLGAGGAWRAWTACRGAQQQRGSSPHSRCSWGCWAKCWTPGRWTPAVRNKRMHSVGARARVGGRQTRRHPPLLVCALPHLNAAAYSAHTPYASVRVACGARGLRAAVRSSSGAAAHIADALEAVGQGEGHQRSAGRECILRARGHAMVGVKRAAALPSW